MPEPPRACLLLSLLATTARAIDPIRAHVITLDVYAPRYGDFLERNPHLVNDLQTWKGVDGRKLGYKKLIHDGVMTRHGVDRTFELGVRLN